MISLSRSKRYTILIVRVRIRSNGSGGKGRGERWRATAGDKSRGGTARDSPEFTKIGAPGIISTRAWVRCGQHVTRDAPRPKTGYGGAPLAGHDCGGGSARRGSPERERSGHWNGLRALGSSVKATGRRAEAYQRRGAVGVAAEGRRRHGRAAGRGRRSRRRVLQGVSGRLVSTGRSVDVL